MVRLHGQDLRLSTYRAAIRLDALPVVAPCHYRVLLAAPERGMAVSYWYSCQAETRPAPAAVLADLLRRLRQAEHYNEFVLLYSDRLSADALRRVHANELRLARAVKELTR